MRKALVFTFEKKRVWLRHGTRAVLCLECELPVAECVAARHASEMAKAIFAHAEREYFPAAAQELESLVMAGRGFAFTPHHVRFVARITPVGGGLCMHLSLSHTVGGKVCLAQSTQSYWTSDGRYRKKRAPRVKKSAKKRIRDRKEIVA